MSNTNLYPTLTQQLILRTELDGTEIISPHYNGLGHCVFNSSESLLLSGIKTNLISIDENLKGILNFAKEKNYISDDEYFFRLSVKVPISDDTITSRSTFININKTAFIKGKFNRKEKQVYYLINNGYYIQLNKIGESTRFNANIYSLLIFSMDMPLKPIKHSSYSTDIIIDRTRGGAIEEVVGFDSVLFNTVKALRVNIETGIKTKVIL